MLVNCESLSVESCFMSVLLPWYYNNKALHEHFVRI